MMGMEIKFKMTMTDIKQAIEKAKEQFVKVEEIRMDPYTEEAILGMIGPPRKDLGELKHLMGIPVVVDPLCPPGEIYIGPKIDASDHDKAVKAIEKMIKDRFPGMNIEVI